MVPPLIRPSVEAAMLLPTKEGVPRVRMVTLLIVAGDTNALASAGSDRAAPPPPRLATPGKPELPVIEAAETEPMSAPADRTRVPAIAPRTLRRFSAAVAPVAKARVTSMPAFVSEPALSELIVLALIDPAKSPGV